MLSCQNAQLPKFPVIKILSCQNAQLSKCPVVKMPSCHKMPSSQNAQLSKCPVVKMPSWENAQLSKVPRCQNAQWSKCPIVKMPHWPRSQGKYWIEPMVVLFLGSPWTLRHCWEATSTWYLRSMPTGPNVIKLFPPLFTNICTKLEYLLEQAGKAC